MNDIKAETRRKSPRAKTSSNEIIYLNFHTGNGAVVLDVSADGLGFQAADTFEPNESLSFRLSVPAFPDMELSGQIAWLDATRKRGGLRVNVPAAVRPAFRSWQARYLDSLPEAAGAAPAQPAPAPAERTNGSETSTHQEPRRSVPPFHPRPFTPLTRPGGPVFVSEWEMPPEGSHVSRNLLAVGVIIALALVAAGGSYYLAGKKQMGGWLIHLGQAISGQSSQPPAQQVVSQNATAAQAPMATDTAHNPSAPGPLSPKSTAPGPSGNSAALAAPELSQPAPAAPSAAPPQAGNTTTSDASNLPAASAESAPPPSDANTLPGKVSGAIPDSSASVALSRSSAGSRAAQTTSDAPTASTSDGTAEAGRADLEQARRLLQGGNSSESAVAADLLWSSIQAGNTQAELVLGDLYLRGNGSISKNCSQARVLLRAAQAANVPGATPELQEMQTYGCR